MKMTDRRKKNRKRICRIAAVLLLTGFLAIGLNGITLEVNIKDVFWEWLLFTGIYGVGYHLFRKRKAFIKRKSVVRQLYIPAAFVTLFWDLAFFSKETDKSNFIAFYGFAALNIFMALLTYLLVSGTERNCGFLAKKIFHCCRENIFLIVICILFVIGSVPIFTSWLNQDGIDYYYYISKMRTWDFTNLRALQMAGHHTELYTMLLMIGEFLLPGYGNGVRGICILLGVLTIIAFDAVLKILFCNCGKMERGLLTAVFAFSPYLFGMLAEINTDFPLLCFFVWMVLFHLKKEFILQAFCGALLCFTKEPGCLIYGTYLLGIVVCIVFENRKDISTMLDKLTARQMLVNYGAGILWIFYFIAIQFRVWGTGAEAGTTAESTGYRLNSFDVWGSYIVCRLKEIFLFNYGWLYWGVICFGAVWLLFRKKINWKSAKNYIPIGAGFGAILLMNTLYVTYPHIRYNIPVLLVQTLFFGAAVLCIIKNLLFRKILLLAVLLVTIWSNFTTDFVSSRLFYCIDGGKGEIACPRLFYREGNLLYVIEDNEKEWTSVNEGVAYNRQYLGRGKCIEELLADIDYQAGDLIVLPDIADNSYMLYRNALLRQTAWTEGKMYWNTEKKMTNANFFFDEALYRGEEWVKINTVVTEEGEQLKDEWFREYDRIFYLKLPMNRAYDHETALKAYRKESYTAENNVWKFEMLKLE